MSTVEVGQAAETLAANWLTQRGFRIIDRNWRTRWCELDIVAESGGTIHIIEVKYRRRSDFGTGFEYITRDKASRLQRAALMWMHNNHFHNRPYQIDIIAVSGSPKPNHVSYLANAVGSN